MGVKGRKLKQYSGDFKMSAVEEVLIRHMGQRETARKYGVTHKMIQSWIRIYLEKGKDYLYNGTKNNQDTIIKELPAIQITEHSDKRPNAFSRRRYPHPITSYLALLQSIKIQLILQQFNN